MAKANGALGLGSEIAATALASGLSAGDVAEGVMGMIGEASSDGRGIAAAVEGLGEGRSILDQDIIHYDTWLWGEDWFYWCHFCIRTPNHFC